jgi:hypothetical protein
VILKEKPIGMKPAMKSEDKANHAATSMKTSDDKVAAERSQKGSYVDRQNCSKPTVHIYRTCSADSHRGACGHTSHSH